MKSKILALLFCLVCVTSFAQISVQCDVIYEKSNGEWSDYHETEVQFMKGSELDESIPPNKLLAVIWFSETNCAIIDMEHTDMLLQKVDNNYIFTYLIFDVLNEGKPGNQINSSDRTVRWRIYGKDENSLLIDPIFDRYPYSNYNERTQENIDNGNTTKRSRLKKSSTA